jgi:defect in organelle trafficking protein DotC
MLNFIAKTFVYICIILLCACASRRYSNSYQNADSVTDLAQLQAMGNTKTNKKKPDSHAPNKIRETAIKETALSLGAQAGLASRAKTIDDELIKHTRYLDKIYDFNALTLEHNVMPPVLLEGRHEFNLADTQTIRVSNRTYRVAKQAHFITTPPNWREYLWMDYQAPEQPHASLLPNTKQERAIWQLYVTRGWEKGVEQANTILEESIARIKQDFNGMILYRKLLAMNMVTPPYVSHTDLGVTGDGDEIHIDDRVLRITALPALNTNPQEWHAAVAKDEEALDKFEKLEQKINDAKITITSETWQPIINSVKP